MPRTHVGRNALKVVGQGALGGGSSSNEPMHPNLGLHGAAASGNIGLIKFALENGQPANSNLNGILPLHAACSGGNEQAVRMLLLHGADVNAPRLKSKSPGGGAGAEGSTPLHFAAANGHLEIVRLLLEAGARPAATDKDGVQAEALAAGNGYVECVKLIRSWISAYGTNGLAGIVSSRETVSRDMSLGPVAYARYAGGQTGLSAYAAPTTPTEEYGSVVGPGGPRREIGLLRGQRSFDYIGPAAITRRPSASSRISSNSRGLLKTSSNPNLKAALAATSQGLTTATPFSGGGSYASGQAALLGGNFATTSPSALHRHAPDRSPSPLDPEEEAELAFSSAVTPAGNSSSSSGGGGGTGSGSMLGYGGGKESKRRPSLPSILEKAAHPAASLRAALGTTAYTPGSGGGDHPDTTAPHSPGKKFSKLAGKRSLSNMLRKATGADKPNVPGSSSASSLLAAAPYEAGPSSTLTPLRPSRALQTSFDTPSLHPDGGTRFERRYPSVDFYGHGDSGESDVSGRSYTAPHYQSAFSNLNGRGESATTIGPSSVGAVVGKPPKLRTSASSSALSADAAKRYASRARSSSNEQTAINMDRSAATATGRPTMASKASLDIPRAEQTYPSSSLAADLSSVYGTRTIGPGSPFRSRQKSSLTAPAGLPRRREVEDTSQQQQPEHESSSDFASSDGSLSTEPRSRSGSQSFRPSLLGNPSMDGRSSKKGDAKSSRADADAEDDQELLGDTERKRPPEADDDHHLPAGLRTLSAMRVPRQDSGAGRVAGLASNAATSNPSSPPAFAAQRGRNRSTSSLSAVSSGSHSGAVNASVHFPDSNQLRDSPGLYAASQALSIADEVGMSQPMNRPSRSGSHAESVSSRPSTSSLRSNYLSSAEQAQVILNQDVHVTTEGPDGAPLSLAAQLAAYGEALAQERKRAGESRSGPSPSLSGRASSAALKSALPSVSEDQSPTAPSPLGSGHNPAERRTLGAPASGTFSGHSYPRRMSRRPHSSEGAESQSIGKRATFRSDVGRSKTLNAPGQHAGLRTLFLETPTPSNLESSTGLSSRALGSPLSPHPPSPVNKGHDSPRARTDGVSGHFPVGATSHGRASEDLLRQQRPTILTWNSDARPSNQPSALPKTPTITSGLFAEGEGTSPRGSHRHSPSAPSQLSSYAASRAERSQSSLPVSQTASALGTPSIAGGETADKPPVPPRKDSYLSPGPTTTPASASPNGLLTPDAASIRSGVSARSLASPQPSTPHYDLGVVGLGFDSDPQAAAGRRRPSWEVPRRPSTSMLRTDTGSSIASQSTATGPDDGPYVAASTKPDRGANQGHSSGATGKRRLVRNFLTGIKNTAAGHGLG